MLLLLLLKKTYPQPGSILEIEYADVLRLYRHVALDRIREAKEIRRSGLRQIRAPGFPREEPYPFQNPYREDEMADPVMRGMTSCNVVNAAAKADKLSREALARYELRYDEVEPIRDLIVEEESNDPYKGRVLLNRLLATDDSGRELEQKSAREQAILSFAVDRMAAGATEFGPLMTAYLIARQDELFRVLTHVAESPLPAGLRFLRGAALFEHVRSNQGCRDLFAREGFCAKYAPTLMGGVPDLLGQIEEQASIGAGSLLGRPGDFR